MSFNLVSHLQNTAMLPASVKDDADWLILGSARILFYEVKIQRKYDWDWKNWQIPGYEHNPFMDLRTYILLKIQQILGFMPARLKKLFWGLDLRDGNPNTNWSAYFCAWQHSKALSLKLPISSKNTFLQREYYLRRFKILCGFLTKTVVNTTNGFVVENFMEWWPAPWS